jgi:molybdopterin-guanine dinucleotide biosynthesis protein A
VSAGSRELANDQHALPLVGVLAGGRSTRMGRDKAWLPAPAGGEALIERLLRIARELGLPAVVVGGNAPAGVECLRDEPPGIGPIGGLCALLARAETQPAIALACDLPYVDAALLAKLARTPSNSAVLAPRDGASGKWQPLFSRYAPQRVLPELRRAIDEGARSLQAVFARVPAEELQLTVDEHAQLRDWDEPADLGC